MRPTNLSLPAPPRRWPRRIGRLAAGLTLTWVAACAALWVGQERLIFHPEPLATGWPLAIEPDVHERFVEVPGARLSVLELRLPQPRGVVFYLHGNAGNLQQWFVNTQAYRQAGLDLVMMDYRGFGKSSGVIQSEAQLHADVEAVWQSVQARYAGKRIVAFGRSLGSGLAAAWAARHQPDLTVLVSPYESLQALTAQHYPWVPGALLRYPLRSDLAVSALHGPLLLLHGDQDTLIPWSHSQTLAGLASSARLVRVPGAGHADVHRFDRYRQALADALAAL